MQAKLGSDDALGIYLHVPFCATTCDFCAFHQDAPERADLDAYLAALESELRLAAPRGRVETVFFGGGTPGLLGVADFEKIFVALRAHTDFRPEEVTVEFAPSTVKPDKARALRALGVTRASLGVQSFDEKLLEALGRRQSARQARAAYDTLRAAGFDNINLDLMFAYPGQTASAWQRDLDEAIALNPEHISTYCLTFEEDTALWVKLTEGGLRRDVAAEADLYQLAWERLPQAGYAQYEVSNFARTGFACAHNLNTWRMGRWRGVGPSAASQDGGWRFANPADTPKWRAAVEAAHAPLACPPPWAVDCVPLSPELLARDALAFGLRMNEGVSLAELRARWSEAAMALTEAEQFLAALMEEGYATLCEDRHALTAEGRLRVDAIGAELVG